MKKAKIFLIGKHVDELFTMVETNYDSELTLQGLLASYPDLLPGDQINPEAPRQWLLMVFQFQDGYPEHYFARSNTQHSGHL